MVVGSELVAVLKKEYRQILNSPGINRNNIVTSTHSSSGCRKAVVAISGQCNITIQLKAGMVASAQHI